MARYEQGQVGKCAVLILALTAGVWAVSHNSAMAQERLPAMENSAAVQSLVRDVIALPVLDQESIGRTFQTVLVRAEDNGNPYIKIFTGSVPEPSPVQKLELRVPSERNPEGGQLLILTTRPDRSIAIAKIRTIFGPPMQVDLPLASAPFGTPTYEGYIYDWGKLTFGYLPAQHDQVRQVIFDRKRIKSPD